VPVTKLGRLVKDGKIKSDRPVEHRRNAAEELKNLPIIDDEDEGEE
jgi:hypothetical protein